MDAAAAAVRAGAAAQRQRAPCRRPCARAAGGPYSHQSSAVRATCGQPAAAAAPAARSAARRLRSRAPGRVGLAGKVSGRHDKPARALPTAGGDPNPDVAVLRPLDLAALRRTVAAVAAVRRSALGSAHKTSLPLQSGERRLGACVSAEWADRRPCGAMGTGNKQAGADGQQGVWDPIGDPAPSSRNGQESCAAGVSVVGPPTICQRLPAEVRSTSAGRRENTDPNPEPAIAAAEGAGARPPAARPPAGWTIPAGSAPAAAGRPHGAAARGKASQDRVAARAAWGAGGGSAAAASRRRGSALMPASAAVTMTVSVPEAKGDAPPCKALQGCERSVDEPKRCSGGGLTEPKAVVAQGARAVDEAYPNPNPPPRPAWLLGAARGSWVGATGGGVEGVSTLWGDLWRGPDQRSETGSRMLPSLFGPARMPTGNAGPPAEGVRVSVKFCDAAPDGGRPTAGEAGAAGAEQGPAQTLDLRPRTRCDGQLLAGAASGSAEQPRALLTRSEAPRGSSDDAGLPEPTVRTQVMGQHQAEAQRSPKDPRDAGESGRAAVGEQAASGRSGDPLHRPSAAPARALTGADGGGRAVADACKKGLDAGFANNRTAPPGDSNDSARVPGKPVPEQHGEQGAGRAHAGPGSGSTAAALASALAALEREACDADCVGLGLGSGSTTAAAVSNASATYNPARSRSPEPGELLQGGEDIDGEPYPSLASLETAVAELGGSDSADAEQLLCRLEAEPAAPSLAHADTWAPDLARACTWAPDQTPGASAGTSGTRLPDESGRRGEAALGSGLGLTMGGDLWDALFPGGGPAAADVLAAEGLASGLGSSSGLETLGLEALGEPSGWQGDAAALDALVDELEALAAGAAGRSAVSTASGAQRQVHISLSHSPLLRVDTTTHAGA